jgi:biopolymer transport protein TolR
MAMGPILGGGRRGRRTPMAEINVTPMVDVMLVLLIIFMVTAPLLVSGVQVDVPETKAEALDQAPDPVALSIDASGAIFIGDDPVSATDLPARLAQIAAGSNEEGGPRVMLRADQSLDYGLVMRVMGELNRAGLRRIAMIGSPAGGGGE